MSMIYLGNSAYFDTDDLDAWEYSEFCKHRENLRKYYDKKDNINAVLKGNMIGIDIKKLVSEAEDFVAVYLLGHHDAWRNLNSDRVKEDIDNTVYIIANDVEE